MTDPAPMDCQECGSPAPEHNVHCSVSIRAKNAEIDSLRAQLAEVTGQRNQLRSMGKSQGDHLARVLVQLADTEESLKTTVNGYEEYEKENTALEAQLAARDEAMAKATEELDLISSHCESDFGHSQLRCCNCLSAVKALNALRRAREGK